MTEHDARNEKGYHDPGLLTGALLILVTIFGGSALTVLAIRAVGF